MAQKNKTMTLETTMGEDLHFFLFGVFFFAPKEQIKTCVSTLQGVVFEP